MNPTFKSRILPNVVGDMVPVGFKSLFLSLREPLTEKNSLVSHLHNWKDGVTEGCDRI